MRFSKELQSKACGQCTMDGFSRIGDQHNGILFAKIDKDGFLQRRVVEINGTIRVYKTRKPTKNERLLYGMT